MSKQLDLDTIQQNINYLQNQIDKLQNELSRQKLAQPKKLEMWQPEDYEHYFIIRDGYGIINSFNDGGEDDSSLITCGNCFPTRELAEHYAKKRAARQRLEMLALAENGMVPYEWTQGRGNYCIGANGYAELIVDYYTSRRDQQYFPTKEAAQRVLDAMTDEDLITLYGTANRGGK